MLDLPFDDLTNPLRLADWLELHALRSSDRNSSQGDLESVLRTVSIFELDDDEQIERKTLEVFLELEQRVKAAAEAYPFDLDYPGVLQLKSDNWREFPVYIFCLCLSYYPLRETRVGQVIRAGFLPGCPTLSARPIYWVRGTARRIAVALC